MAKKKQELPGLEIIGSKIFLLRNQKVMLDRDLASLYGVKPIRLREQVKRNIGRFPDDFMFRLSSQEIKTMVSQNAIPSKQHLGGHRPYAFTEYGVLMLANVLKSKRAIDVSVRIIKVFVKMRELIMTQKDLLVKIEQLERKFATHDEDLSVIFQTLKQLLRPSEPKRRMIGFKVDKEV